MWKNAEGVGAKGDSSNSGYDPIFEDPEIKKTGKSGREFFDEGKRSTEVRICENRQFSCFLDSKLTL